MSLILEALRKSEEQRRLGQAPTLASVPVWTRRQPRRPWLPFAIGTLIVAAVVSGWWLGQHDPATAGATKRESADAPSRRARDNSPATAPEIVPPTTAAVAPAGVVVASPGNVPTTGGVPLRARRERENPEVFANSPDLVRPAPPTQETPYVPPEAALPEPLPDPENTALDPAMPVAPPPVPRAATQIVPPPPPPAPAAEATSPAPAQDAAAAVAAPPPATMATGADAVPLIFELPLATRQELPPLKLNMHVYNADPAGRFVIIDGTRAAEGGPLPKELTVIEIRPDGIVLEFRAQRFLLPRTGR